MTSIVEQFLNSKALLRVNNTGEAICRDLKVATAVLLMHMAGSGGAVLSQELSTVIDTLGRQFGLRAEEVGEILEISQFLLAEKGHVKDFLKIINERLEKSQKVTLMAMLWKVMVADGLVTRSEAELAAELCGILQLGAGEVEAAKTMLERGEV